VGSRFQTRLDHPPANRSLKIAHGGK
jgi:hypothetical protein